MRQSRCSFTAGVARVAVVAAIAASMGIVRVASFGAAMEVDRREKSVLLLSRIQIFGALTTKFCTWSRRACAFRAGHGLRCADLDKYLGRSAAPMENESPSIP